MMFVEWFSVIRNTRLVGGMSIFLFLFIAVSYTSSSKVVRRSDTPLCPSEFTPISESCYKFSTNTATFDEAHHDCLTSHSSLAELSRSQEFALRRYINKHTQELGSIERWIGGKFDSSQKKWIWAIHGKPLTFQAFSRMGRPSEKYNWHCIIIDPAKQNKWSARPCFDKIHYICQTSMNKNVKYRHNLEFDLTKCSDPKYLKPHEKKLCLIEDRKRHPNDPAAIIKLTPTTSPKPIMMKKKYKKLFVCPSNMIILGRKCYFFSTTKAQFHDAYNSCLENQTSLAIIRNIRQDMQLKDFLNSGIIERRERWLGGMYDWHEETWKWITSKHIKYTGFADGVLANRSLAWNAIIMDPHLGYQWNARKRMDKKHYICQKKPHTVVRYERRMEPPKATVIIQADSMRVLPTKPTYYVD